MTKKKKIYEIVWTIEGCEAITYISSDKWYNTTYEINYRMLPSAINLYQYYKNDKVLEAQYRELLNLVCVGIVKYARDECNRADEAIDYINQVLEKKEIQLIDSAVLKDFLN